MSLIILDTMNTEAVVKVIDAVLDFAGQTYYWEVGSARELAEENKSLRQMLGCVQRNLVLGAMGKTMQKTQAKAIEQFLEEL